MLHGAGLGCGDAEDVAQITALSVFQISAMLFGHIVVGLKYTSYSIYVVFYSKNAA